MRGIITSIAINSSNKEDMNINVLGQIRHLTRG